MVGIGCWVEGRVWGGGCVVYLVHVRGHGHGHVHVHGIPPLRLEVETKAETKSHHPKKDPFHPRLYHSSIGLEPLLLTLSSSSLFLLLFLHQPRPS